MSRSAVSRTFTPDAYVSKATREKVLRAAKTLDYHPNAMARSLITQKSGIIGVVSADLQNPFYADTLEKIGTALQERGFASLVLLAMKPVQNADLPDTIVSGRRSNRNKRRSVFSSHREYKPYEATGCCN
ncbi:LacI family transcriptional regulator [Ochrobactrum haematophilum]|uniref:LacI family transcriptional regulator n=1 Tax=Brucella haematophila TaxID=419474 RepID=A0ABX1DQ50_9HYPH|nr:LacI family transcriptional regulator [Brucella haematophila]